MTAPDLVEVVAGVIREHVIGWQFDGRRSRLECDCGAEVIAGDGSAHQARAVLDALAEAGSVEWGALHRKRKVPYRYAKEQDARNSAKANHGVLVSRLALPWAAVE